MSLLTAPLRPLVAAALCLSLAACGGGGDGGCSTCALLALTTNAPASATTPPSVEGVPSTQNPGPAATDPVTPAAQVEPTAPAESGTPPTGDPAPPTPSYVIGGTLTGLANNTKLVLLDNNGDALTLAANGAFSFAAPIAFNTAYTVAVGTQPLWQNCSVSNGSGTATAGVSNVQVNCADALAQVSTFAGSAMQGSTDGTGTAASFGRLQSVAVDASGNVYAADAPNNMIRKISPAGVVSTLAGSTTPGWADGPGAAARFDQPSAVAADASGNVYVGDYGNNMIRKITPNGDVSTLAGAGPTTPGSANGTGTNASFNGPWGIDVDAVGNVYVLDGNNLLIRKVTPNGTVSTLAGSMTSNWIDGQGAAASFVQPNGLRLDAGGNVYVADANMIRKITPEGLVSTLAGSTTAGFADGTGGAARFNGAWGLGVDAGGNLYMADISNNMIRKITPEGVVTTLAGSQTAGSADGIGTTAQFNNPYDVAVGPNGDLYVAEGLRLRKITPVR